MDNATIFGTNGLRREDRERWEKTIQILSQEISEEEFSSWFDGLRLGSLKGSHAHLIVSTSYRKDWMARQYTDFLEAVMGKIWGRKLSVSFVSPEDFRAAQDKRNNSSRSKSPVAPTLEDCGLNPGYTFENFVEGEHSRMAHAAALAVADSPAYSYNPLFIHGGVGLGKTHLMQAIGHRVREFHPQMRVLYLPAETFINDFIDAIRRGDRVEFKDKYRRLDVLLVDDIHFLAGKEGTQDEFFHTFNSLHNENKQIVISSDRPPKEIATLSDRLRSRFGWGLIADIKPPDVETRTAIIRKKCDMSGTSISDDIALYIASKIEGNVRELEGALLRLIAYMRSCRTPLSLQSAVNLLTDLIPQEVQQMTIESIQRRVAEYFHVKTSDLLGKNRSKSVTFPRHVAMYLCKTLTEHSLTEIGAYFGNKDHTTVLYSCRKIESSLGKNSDMQNTMERITAYVRQAANR